MTVVEKRNLNGPCSTSGDKGMMCFSHLLKKMRNLLRRSGRGSSTRPTYVYSFLAKVSLPKVIKFIDLEKSFESDMPTQSQSTPVQWHKCDSLHNGVAVAHCVGIVRTVHVVTVVCIVYSASFSQVFNISWLFNVVNFECRRSFGNFQNNFQERFGSLKC